MGTQYLIDSNAVIDYLSGKLPPNGMTFMDRIVNAVPKVSVITKIEVLGYYAPPTANQLQDSTASRILSQSQERGKDFLPR